MAVANEVCLLFGMLCLALGARHKDRDVSVILVLVGAFYIYMAR